MIQFNQVSKQYSGIPLLEEVSFSLSKGEKCGIVGRNGSGKSTLFRLIAGKETEDQGEIQTPKNYRFGILEQHRIFTEKNLIEESAKGFIDLDKERYKVEKVLLGLGFSKEDFEKKPSAFSGGYQLRIQLAKVILSDPDCLLLDEPTNYLDIVSIRWLMRFLKTWKKELLLISHDRFFMDEITTHTLGIYRKKVKKIKGSTQDFFTLMEQEDEVHERTRGKLEKKKDHAEKFIKRFGAKATKAKQAKSKLKAIEKLPILDSLRKDPILQFSFRYQPFHGKKMMEAKNIFFSYLEEDPLIQNFSLLIEPKVRVAIIGKNGRGKSTLLKLLASIVSPEQGQVEASVNTKIGFFGQTHVDELNPKKTIEEEISDANPKLSPEQIKSIAGAMLFSQDASQKPISVLSGGEKSRVVLGKILAKEVNLLFLDEPTHHLDIESIEILMKAIQDFEGSVILVTHSEEILREFHPETLIICEKHKQKMFLGDYDNFLEKEGFKDEQDLKEEKSKQNKVSFEEQKEQKRKIERLEKKIDQLDLLLEENIEEMAKASLENNLPKLQKLTLYQQEKEKEKEKAFQEWEKLLQEVSS